MSDGQVDRDMTTSTIFLCHRFDLETIKVPLTFGERVVPPNIEA